MRFAVPTIFTTMRQRLPTWTGRSTFEYDRASDGSITLHYGKGCVYCVRVPGAKLQQLLSTFAGREVPIGTSKTDPPKSSLGFWLQQNVTKTAIASYVGPLLIKLGYAQRGSRADLIRFN